MATFIERLGPNGRTVWQVKVRRAGFPQQSRTFDTRPRAEKWARHTETDMERGDFVSSTEAASTILVEALDRYERDQPQQEGVSGRAM